MDSESTDPSTQPPVKDSNIESSSNDEEHSMVSATRDDSLNLGQPQQTNSETGGFRISAFSLFSSGFGLRLPNTEESGQGTATSTQGGVLESFTKGLVDSSRSAVKAMQVKARHVVSQNKRRYQEGGFDLDMAYITENVIAMGFPAGDISSGLFGFFEGFYRNHMEEVIKFFETHHKGKFKVYNLCSERLYDASRFEGKVACFPFDDHNCPPLQLITSFCQSAYLWLKEDIQNVVVVHCKAGMGRTGLMICSLLLFLKFFPTAEEAIDYFNQKRCVDGKALVLPRVLCDFDAIAFTRIPQKVIIFLQPEPEDFWIRARKKKMVVFALPGEPGVTELAGDFKIHFHDRQGDFYCWLNTTMTENRKMLNGSDLDGFDKRKLPSPGFQVEVVMIDYDGTLPARSKVDSAHKGSDVTSSGYVPATGGGVAAHSNRSDATENDDDVFSDSEGEETGVSKSRQAQAASRIGPAQPDHASNSTAEQMRNLTHGAEQLSLRSHETSPINASKEPTAGEVRNPAPGVKIRHVDSGGASDIKAIAADASVFTFGDEDYESE
ncbi:unnamed protein product [Dovyalis caffra]|uniref:Uncharacterized protein n=1 Tax=Dovyalis caffra TaxID=77055 RepID=A0AAV1RLY0_9ROSI|nr:unnamed protein product [Dovyalis caffra]